MAYRVPPKHLWIRFRIVHEPFYSCGATPTGSSQILGLKILIIQFLHSRFLFPQLVPKKGADSPQFQSQV